MTSARSGSQGRESEPPDAEPRLNRSLGRKNVSGEVRSSRAVGHRYGNADLSQECSSHPFKALAAFGSRTRRRGLRLLLTQAATAYARRARIQRGWTTATAALRPLDEGGILKASSLRSNTGPAAGDRDHHQNGGESFQVAIETKHAAPTYPLYGIFSAAVHRLSRSFRTVTSPALEFRDLPAGPYRQFAEFGQAP